MKAIMIFIIAIPNLSIQQYYNQALSIGNYHLPYTYEKQYVSGTYHRSSHRHRHPRKYGNNEGHLAMSYESSDTYTDSYQDTCECDCQRCADPKPCCKRACAPECLEQMPTNLVFVPYPYPLVMPDVHPSTAAAAVVDTTTSSTTTTTTTPKAPTAPPVGPTVPPVGPTVPSVGPPDEPTEAPPVGPPNEPQNVWRLKECNEKLPSNRIGNSFYEDLRSNMKSRQGYQKDLKEQLGIRPVRPNTIPKYGIVPIPDKILQSLFSQIRNIKRTY